MLPYIFRGHDEHGFFIQGMGMSRTRRLRPLPGNQPAAGARYICVLALRNYNNMELAVASHRGADHYTRAIEPAVLDDIRAGRAALVLDLSNEGPAYYAPIFEPLYDWIQGQGLPAGRVIWLAQNRAMQRRATASAGARAALLRFEHYDYFPKWMAWHFAQTPPAPPPARRPDRLLLCLNATPRLQRVLTVAALLHAGLIEESLVSFPGMDYAKQGNSAAQVRRFVAAHAALAYLREPVERAMALPPMRVDSFAEEGNQLADKIDPAPYQRSFFSLVTESDLSDGGITRITEKVVKAFAMGHPSLIVGNPRSTGFLTDLGFQDWTNLLNRDHETIDAPAERFQATMYETRRQIGLIRDDPEAWLAAAAEVSAFNRHHAASGGLLAHMEATQDAPLAEAFSRLVGL